ncbi:MAG: TetR/AcrR family transcriptional regulator [Solirubrobacterales bacterium]|nr:TetR/AcrR family transcriptional regulator [Solirubrobacterales bacterium]MBV9916218.1 TetR/AcrR family transcriptional regulator [Solirubrobacterales bacterium]
MSRSRRDQILAAALAEFTAHGVAGASIEDIRRRSGASVGSIYHHFDGKDEIAGALAVEGLGSYQQGFLARLADARSTRAGVQDAVRHHIGWIAEHRDLARFLLLGGDARATGTTQRRLRELNRRFFAGVQSWTAPRVRAGELRDLGPELLTALWIGPSQELARHWLAGRIQMSLTDAATELAGAAWRSLKTGGD